jgi:hypothetical protein
MSRQGIFRAPLAVALVAGLAGLAWGGETILKNDRFPNDVSAVADAQLSIQAGFVAGEVAAAVLAVPAGLRPPIRVTKVQVMWASTGAGVAPLSTQGSILVYRNSVLQPGAQLLFDSSEDAAGGDGLVPVLSDGVLNEFDFSGEDITLLSRPGFITVGLRFSAATNQTSGPSVCSDRPPGNSQFQTPGRNAIFGTWPLAGITTDQWFEPRISVGGQTINGISGNFFIRAVVEGSPCLADIAGPGLTVVPDGALTADDIIVFLNRFFASISSSDVAGPGQSTFADGEFTADDIIVFLNAFFAGC